MKKIKLDNGIVLYLDPVRNARTIGLCIVVNIGSIYEPKDKRGISHFLEHMLFKSNEKYSYKQIAESVELSGGCMNAITSTMVTSYIFEVIPRSFKKIIDIAFHMFKNTKFVESEFESEKKVVLSEIERDLNDPEARLWDTSMQAAYGSSDYGDPIQGFRETVESIEKNELEEFKAKFYTPDNMHIILSGNFSKRHVEDVKKVFCKLEGACARKKKPRHGKGKNIVMKMHTENQIYYSLNFPVHCDLHIIEAFENFVCGGMSSLLFQIFREKYGIGYELFFGCNTLYPNERALISLMVPGFEKERKSLLKHALCELFETLQKENLEKYYEGRKRMLKLDYEKTRKDIFERLEESYKIVMLYNESFDEFMKKVFQIKLEEIIDFALSLKKKRGKEVWILPK